MRIAIIYDCIYPYVKGGVEKRNWEISKRLAQKGHEIHLYGMKDWEGDSDLLNEGVHIHGLGKRTKRYTSEGRRSITQALKFSLLLTLRLLKEKKEYDVIECSSSPYLSAYPTKAYCMLKGTRFLITWHEVWDGYWNEYLGPVKGSIGRTIEKITARLPDTIISVSNATKDDLEKIGVNKDKIETIPNGISLDEIIKIGPSQSKQDILFVGRLIKEKNANKLIEAVGLIKKKNPEIYCTIVGEGPEKENLVKLVKDLNLEKNIQFIGFMQDHNGVISLMRSSKLFVLPSTREGFGIVVLEAMTAGLPVIGVNSKNSRCMSELIKDGENGVLLTDVNNDVLSEKISSILNDEETRYNMGLKGSERSFYYDWKRIADLTEGIYKNTS